MATGNILAADIGSVSVALVEISPTGELVRRAYQAHHGRVALTLRHMLSSWDLNTVGRTVSTTGTPQAFAADATVDWITAHVSAHSRLHPEVRNLLVVGGERFALIQFDENGVYRNARGNSSCAAGTGAFLDQQAARLGLAGASELARLAVDNTGARPKVASRCSVFAKTDIIHAQQEGYTPPEICDGLCHGMARNLIDALVTGSIPGGRFVMAGGVAQNAAVVRHVAAILERSIDVDDLAPLYGAYGAALAAAEDEYVPKPATIDTIVPERSAEPTTYYEPIPPPADYPDFSAHERFLFRPTQSDCPLVEVDRYQDTAGTGDDTDADLYLGIDVGSTSTKAALMDVAGSIRTAYYTRTAGKPVEAVRGIFEAIDATAPSVTITGAAVTGSGRKLIGGIVGADLILDEISAHARAAVELDPLTDTIIEIGGQDAKFTTLRRGRVTFSQMNAVCAAGTGSFLEEQAARLNSPLSAYADLAIGQRAPLTSDRCTVFMERDLNHYFNKGYSTEQLLAAALHSVRENYLQKVANQSAIGTHVCFQGATAKNPALVGAFEQRLGQAVHVSLFCHITGAYGAALTCRDERALRGDERQTAFRGVALYQTEIPLRSERCSLCPNHCRLTVAEVDSSQVAYGFLCGRDYATQSFVSADTSGFDLMRERQAVIDHTYAHKAAETATRRGLLSQLAESVLERVRDGLTEAVEEPIRPPVIGIPTGLHLSDEHHYWCRVFTELGFRTRVPGTGVDALAEGKLIEGAEFCAPVAAFHGQVSMLLKKADCVFVPIVLESAPTGEQRRAYCYYTQFTPSVLAGTVHEKDRERLLMPVLWGGARDPATELHQSLLPWAKIPIARIRDAMSRARERQDAATVAMRSLYREQRREDDLNVVILGRPYTVLDESMNKGIPAIVGRVGVRCFYQDMLPHETPSEASRETIQGVHWRYAADILLAADYIAHTRGLYPVLVTSFKCAPDAFCIDSFKGIMESRDKPYLILQLDEHDSSVGYETRIEAAVRSFRNHYEENRPMPQPRHPVTPALEAAIGDKTLLLPAWDPITSPLLAASLRANGINAVPLDESELSIRKSMRLNAGQCIPVSAIAQDAMDYVVEHNLDPKKTVLWMGRAGWSCGIPLYPRFLKGLFVQEGLPDLGVYVGEFTYTDISSAATISAYFAYEFAGWLRQIACRIRPYECVPGRTDQLVDLWKQRLMEVFEQRGNRLRALQQMVRDFSSVGRTEARRPKVAIFGDLYVRDNDVMNQNLIRRIEDAGGEAITTPYSDYVKIIAGAGFLRMWRERDLVRLTRLRLILSAVESLELLYRREVEPIIGPSIAHRRSNLSDDLKQFGMVLEQHGESYENALKILHLVARHEDLALFVQTSPAFCCPSLVTEALGAAIEGITGVPIVTVTYDGTEADKNSVIVPYIKYPRSAKTA